MKIINQGKSIRFQIRAIPKSSKNAISRLDDETIKLRITSPPVDGKANEAVIRYISEILDVSKSSVNIISGHKSKVKVIEVFGNVDLLTQKLLSAITSQK